jgi:hypothetical protein
VEYVPSTSVHVVTIDVVFVAEDCGVDVADAETEMMTEAPGIGMLPDFTMP